MVGSSHELNSPPWARPQLHRLLTQGTQTSTRRQGPTEEDSSCSLLSAFPCSLLLDSSRSRTLGARPWRRRCSGLLSGVVLSTLGRWPQWRRPRNLGGFSTEEELALCQANSDTVSFQVPMVLDGKKVSSKTSTFFDVHNPATGETPTEGASLNYMTAGFDQLESLVLLGAVHRCIGSVRRADRPDAPMYTRRAAGLPADVRCVLPAKGMNVVRGSYRRKHLQLLGMHRLQKRGAANRLRLRSAADSCAEAFKVRGRSGSACFSFFGFRDKGALFEFSGGFCVFLACTRN